MTGFVLVIVLVVSSCAEENVAPSEITLDSGRPMSDNLKAYDVEHYTLRNDIQIDRKSIAGSAEIRFVASTDMSVLELDFEGRYTIEFFERKVGPYPWGQEKLGVAETPHLGMEHQTINAYGNQFRRGEYGFDWLFHHELAHEWFGNLMTHETVSDMWLHEGFGAFMQPEYTREVLGDAAFYSSMYRSYRGIDACNPIAPVKSFLPPSCISMIQGAEDPPAISTPREPGYCIL